MSYRLEITLKPELKDPEGEMLVRKAKSHLNITLSSVRAVSILMLDIALTREEQDILKNQVFTNPVTQLSSYNPVDLVFDWIIWIGYRPGVKDNPGSTAKEAIEDILNRKLSSEEAVYSSKYYAISGKSLTHSQLDKLAGELLANDIIQQWKIFSKKEWDSKTGIGIILPKVILNHEPTVTHIAIDTPDLLMQISNERNLALNVNDIPTIREYFLDPIRIKERKEVGLFAPTDLELEYISQARSDHCNHNTFSGLFRYKDLETGISREINNLFKTYIKDPTLKIKAQKPWVISVLWDNAGTAKFDDNYQYVITGETHNSPSNMEAYGGAITGIVGIYRDPMGTGKGSKLIMGSFGFCTGFTGYDGSLRPRLHPRRLLDGVVEGVKDGGNKSGIPTMFGQTYFHHGYMGKCLVFVTALGIMPMEIDGQRADQKTITPGSLIVMSGGRVGKDGIHGVTASSEVFSSNTPIGHVQIGDPYTQKKMHDFLLEARDEGLIEYITDNGGGGLSSSVGETARSSGGCEVELEKVPLKYEGMDQWEIWVSESQERMTIAIRPEHIGRFMELSQHHGVESTIIGRYTNSGKLHIRYNGITCAYIDLDLLTVGFPQWEFDAEWQPPERRGLYEPVLTTPTAMNDLLLDILQRPNICSKEWIFRQYDHEVQGTSVVKPLVGLHRDVPTDATVLRPLLHSERGLVFTQAIIPAYSFIDAYHMTACTIDEAIRRVVAVGGDLSQVGGIDNFCWPDIQYHPTKNPDGKFKAAQLVRSCRAMADMCDFYQMPLLSGKDSMYIDGHLQGRYGETHKISGPETLQFAISTIIEDVKKSVTLEPKVAGDIIYVIGETRNELGASEYYEHLGYLGNRVPHVIMEETKPLYEKLAQAIQEGIIASAHGIYRGGLAVHLSLMVMASDLGIQVELKNVSPKMSLREDVLLFSESAGRFIVTIDPIHQKAFEVLFSDAAIYQVGKVMNDRNLTIIGNNNEKIITLPISSLRDAWKKPYGDL